MKDRGPLLWVAVIVAGIIAIVGVGALLSDDDSNEVVSAGESAQSVCGTIGVWRGELEATVEDIRTPTAAGSGYEEPQSETPQGRTGFVRQGLERAVQATETMVTGVENAGIPDTPGTVVHAKVVVADDVVSFGTVNLDAWALYRNSEIMMIVRSPAAAALFEERLFEPDIRRSQPGVSRSGARDRLESWFWDKLTSFL